MDPSLWPAFIQRLTIYVEARVPAHARDDVVGEILLKLSHHRRTLAAARDPFAWIRRVAANTVTDHHRRQASEQRAMAAFASEYALSGGPSEAASSVPSASGDLAACVPGFIRRLPSVYRDALTLVEIDGLSQKAAAARMGLSVSGMKSRVQRGRRRLKDAILRCCAVQLSRRGDIVICKARISTEERPCCPPSRIRADRARPGPES